MLDAAKYWLISIKPDLLNKKPVTIENLTNELNSSANSWVTQQIFEKAITIVKKMIMG